MRKEVKKMLKYFHQKKAQKGFTLIELLVVIAIIGVLATIVLVSLNTARSKARDVRRASDMRQVALAMEIYYDNNDAYPAGDATADNCGDWTTIGTAMTGDEIGAMPSDPGNNIYTAEVNAALTDYVLRAEMENSGAAGLETDIDTATYGCTCNDASSPYYYCIKP